MDALFDYSTSWLNPALKLVIAGLFVFVAYVFLRTRSSYRGDLYRVLTVLFSMGAVAAIAAVFRYFGHGTLFGFTEAFSLKWFESLGYVVQATLYAMAAWGLAKGIIPDVRD